jgi:hypothetical protein
LFTQYTTGQTVYGVTEDFKVLSEMNADDCGDLHLEVNGTKIAITDEHDYDRAVEMLKGVGWTDEQIDQVFEQLGMDREVLSGDEG